MQARDFFDDVDFAFHIETPRGDGDLELVGTFAYGSKFETKPGENAQNLLCGGGLPEDSMDFGEIENDRSLVAAPDDNVHDVAVEHATAGVQDQFGNAVC